MKFKDGMLSYASNGISQSQSVTVNVPTDYIHPSLRYSMSVLHPMNLPHPVSIPHLTGLLLLISYSHPKGLSVARSQVTPLSYPDIRLGLWNAHSITNKLPLLHSLVISKDLDIFCITESWLQSSIKDGEVAPCDFTVYRHDRDTRGGGVLIAVSNRFASRIILSSSVVELVVIEVFVSPKFLYLHHVLIVIC